MKNELMRERRLINQLTEEKTLELFRVGCDEINYQILKSLPLTEKDIRDLIEKTVMPTNKRINDLINANLVRRSRMGGHIELTRLGGALLDRIDAIKETVIEQLVETN